MLNDLKGKSVLITGASSGIGAAVARGFADCGAAVAIHYASNAEGAQAVADAITAAGGTAVIVQADLTDPKTAKGMVEEAAQKLGNLDILVNNAGIVQNGPSESVAVEDWRRVIDVNLHGVFHCAQAFGKEMVKAGKGSIVSISSICGSVTVHPQPQAAYNASKAAVNLLTKSLAVEWAQKGVRVNAVAPGYTATELTLAGRSRPEWYDTWMRMTPMGRLGEPREVANAVVFLASDAASYITGTVLMVDGGYTAM